MLLILPDGCHHTLLINPFTHPVFVMIASPFEYYDWLYPHASCWVDLALLFFGPTLGLMAVETSRGPASTGVICQDIIHRVAQQSFQQPTSHNSPEPVQRTPCFEWNAYHAAEQATMQLNKCFLFLLWISETKVVEVTVTPAHELGCFILVLLSGDNDKYYNCIVVYLYISLYMYICIILYLCVYIYITYVCVYIYIYIIC